MNEANAMNPFRRLSCLITILLLSACAGKEVQEPKRLLLSYEGPAPVETATLRPRLVVRAVAVPDYLDRRSLIYRGEGSEVRSHDNAEWAERPAKSITRWITQAIGAQRADYSVLSYTTTDGRSPDATLSLTLDAFERGRDGRMRLRGGWGYSRLGEAASLTGRFDADVSMSAATPEATVIAMQDALRQAVDSLIQRIPPAASISAKPGSADRQ